MCDTQILNIRTQSYPLMIYLSILVAVILVMAMAATRNALVHQNGPVNTTLGILAGRTALSIEAAFNAITASFLMKRLRYYITIEGVTAGQGPFALVLANGDVTAAEASAAITEAWTTGPGDRTQELTQDNAWNVYQNTMELMTPFEDGSKWISSGEWHSLGKGYPMPETSGWQVLVINLDNGVLTTGASINGIVQYQGVWLDA